MIKFKKIILALFIASFFVSCSSPKRIVYFYTNEKPDTSNHELVNAQPRPQLHISPDDILAITISSADAFVSKDPTAIFNEGGVPVNLTATAGVNATVKGYLVDASGNIDFPVVGKVNVGGLTIADAKEKLIEKLKSYIKSPIAEIRIVNYKVNMLGEVARVGPVFAPNHKINILEAITAAGDIPLTGKKEKVLLIREKENNKLEFNRINLNSKSLFSSPYYYLQKNDIVYVEPNRLKRQQTNEFFLFYLPTISTLIATALSVYGIVQLTKK